MATLHVRTSRGQKYWSIVESRRINGKPRPVILMYLGKAETLLKKLQQGIGKKVRVKSYSHGAVAAMLRVAQQLDVVEIINRHIKARRANWPDRPLRNNLTAGITLLLAAIGRVCLPTSKRGWWDWAKTTTCELLLRTSFSKIDSQHFWDLMDCLPVEAIEKIELELLEKVQQTFGINGETIFYDTTNFYTFIDTTNGHCDIAQRGKNKQKRNDLRQVGLALVVTKQDYIPLLHYTYHGNMNDTRVFQNVIQKISLRMQALKMDLDSHTLVFDRGCNSKDNLALVSTLKLHYVGALTPSHHVDLIQDAEGHFEAVTVGDTELELYRDKRVIWGEERTVVVFISQQLKDGQLRGVYQALNKKKKRLKEIQCSLANPNAKARDRKKLTETLDDLLKGQFMDGLLSYELTAQEGGRFSLNYTTNSKQLDELENRLGFRILMTDRHAWSSSEIVSAFYGQSTVEQAFKNIKNPYHLAVTPGFHWTDQKIKVHYFCCVLGYLLAALIWKEARNKTSFHGTLDSLLDSLNHIRLTTMLEITGKRGKPAVKQQLEDMDEDQILLFNALALGNIHEKPLKIQGVGVYT